MKTTFTREKALERVAAYNEIGISCSLSYLPIRKHKDRNIKKDIREYLALFEEITSRNLDSDVTIKLMQFGVSEGHQFVKRELQDIFEAGAETGIRVWIDQGLAKYVDEVISFTHLHEPGEVGVCLQACRKRTEKDIESVEGYPIRFVKGFYNDYDIHPWSAVTENYKNLMDKVAEYSPFPCYAGHDYHNIDRAKHILKNRQGEIQFFAGVRDTLAPHLLREGFKVRIYVPYGNVGKFILRGLPEFDLPREIQRILHLPTIR